MSFLGNMFEQGGVFDLNRKGRYDEGSFCGFAIECENVKECIRTTCVPTRSIYGGAVYDDCISYCNYDSSTRNIKEMFCQNPEAAFKYYDVDCEGYTPKSKPGYINIFGTQISMIALGSFFLFVMIMYLLLDE